MSPDKLPIAASMDLVSANGELDVPHVRVHLPENEATRFSHPTGAGGTVVNGFVCSLIS